MGIPSLFSGSILETEGIDSLSGDVASRKKMCGVIAYEVPKDFSKFEIYFNNTSLSINRILFTITKDDVDILSIK